ncbi:hypothetical protein E2R60_06875 [Paenibacillus dendritiformis]|uniref:hypothetical protein n=1 Tax=Paenibacillus dendritiformis TaxID=130049 RepID=UPI00105A78B4|nr:hypothetical protein [Paenibacillus dendritiformis]TDL58172.1 hypothetical protein E2R60_06875 [Paenibacillus dendritiformis]
MAKIIDYRSQLESFLKYNYLIKNDWIGCGWCDASSVTGLPAHEQGGRASAMEWDSRSPVLSRGGIPAKRGQEADIPACEAGRMQLRKEPGERITRLSPFPIKELS